MYSRTLKTTLEIRSMFFEGLYGLMTNEERRYFWGKEIMMAIGIVHGKPEPVRCNPREECFPLSGKPLGT